MRAADIAVGMTVEDRRGRPVVVLGIGWRKIQFSHGYMQQEWPDVEVDGVKYRAAYVEKGGRGILVGLPGKFPTAVVIQPANLHPVGTYAAEELAYRIDVSNHAARQIEREDIRRAKIRAFWGDAADEVLATNIHFNTAIVLGEIHYRAMRGKGA